MARLGWETATSLPAMWSSLGFGVQGLGFRSACLGHAYELRVPDGQGRGVMYSSSQGPHSSQRITTPNLHPQRSIASRPSSYAESMSCP